MFDKDNKADHCKLYDQVDKNYVMAKEFEVPPSIEMNPDNRPV